MLTAARRRVAGEKGGRMADWSEGDLPVGGIAIHYYRMGDRAKPPVVMLHGFTDAGICWLRLATDLAPDYDVIALDAAGHGKSGGLEHGFRSRAVSDVIAAIDGLGLERPALVGHSMGGSTASGVAAVASERLRGIVLEDPPWRDTPPAARGPEVVARMRALKEMSAEERYAQAARDLAHWAESERIPWADSKGQLNLGVYDEAVDFGRPPWREVVAKITCPTLLITADPERGAIVTPETAREASSLWRTGRVVQIAGAGHNIRRDRYEPFRAAVTGFLREVSS
jgi:pimeloyl-ACP methyl ester carboxylesterase